MKYERTVKECTYRPSDTAPPCVVLIDPDPLSAKRFTHGARWTWTDEEALFFASLVLTTRIDDMTASGHNQRTAGVIESLTKARNYITGIIDPNDIHVQRRATKKRLTPKRKGA